MPDAASSVLLTVGIGAAVLALVQSPEWGWDDARTIASFVVGFALLTAVVRRSLHHPRPLLELALFRDMRFRIGNIALLVFSISFFGFLLTSVLFLTDVWDYSIRRAGLLTTPVFAGTALMSVVAGRVVRRIGRSAHGWLPRAVGRIGGRYQEPRLLTRDERSAPRLGARH